MKHCVITIQALLLGLGLILALPGCQRGQDSESAPASTVEVDESLSGRAVSDLATRLDIPAAGIQRVSEEKVTWRDGSLGCPKEGAMYTQALVEGTLIVLRVGGRDYQYHAGAGKPPFYCKNPVSPAPGSTAE